MEDEERRTEALRLACSTGLVTTKHILQRAQAFTDFLETGKLTDIEPMTEAANPYAAAIEDTRANKA